MRIVALALQWLAVILIAHSPMLIGADEITTLERGRILTIRSLHQILSLYHVDPSAWLAATLPSLFAAAAAIVHSWPAWAFFAGAGIIVYVLSVSWKCDAPRFYQRVIL